MPLPAKHFLYSSGSVTEGHPDKLCDRVCDAVLDACLAQDAESRVVCDAVAKSGMVMILGQVVTKASLSYEQVIREATKSVGYDSEDKGLDRRTMNVIVAVEDQGPDITAAIAGTGSSDDPACGGMVVASGYATDESPDGMPLSHSLAAKLCAQMDKLSKEGSLAWLRPGARVQVTLEYQEEADGAVVPVKVHSVSIIYSHSQDVKAEQAEQDLLKEVVNVVLPERLVDSNTKYQMVARPMRAGACDSGLAGQQLDADTYGGWVASGTKLSGRDGSSLSRNACYAARWAALSLVSARLCRRCIVQLSFAPNAAAPAVSVQTFGSGSRSGKSDAELAELVSRNFDLSPNGLKRDLRVGSAQFQRLSAYGHFGRTELDLPWEKPKAFK